jgi:hypothetical protein
MTPAMSAQASVLRVSLLIVSAFRVLVLVFISILLVRDGQSTWRASASSVGDCGFAI